MTKNNYTALCSRIYVANRDIFFEGCVIISVLVLSRIDSNNDLNTRIRDECN
jgi:hypothetical protein